MLIKLKYKGTSGSGLTQNSIYTVLAIGASSSPPHAVIIDDNNAIQLVSGIDNTSNWELSTVEVTSLCQIFP